MASLMAGCSGDEATWRYDTAPPAGDDGGDDDDDDDDDDLEYEKWLWGELDGDEGWTGYSYADPEQGGELCELMYEVESWVSTDGCEACTEAWTITRGEEEIWTDVDGTCGDEGWTGLQGSSLGVGHDGDQVWADLGEGWQSQEEAWGEHEYDWAWFEIWLGD